jgi:hypothetical protein
MRPAANAEQHMMKRYLIWLLCLLPLAQGCYSFKGISIDPEVSTFFVRNFETLAPNAPPTLGLDFGERLKDKVRTETRLLLRSAEPDVEFTGKITDFRVVPVAPKPGETVSLNRLEIRMKIGYLNNKNEKKGWVNERDFSHFAEFSNDTELLAVQDQLILQVGNQLLEDIFNAAFNDW